MENRDLIWFKEILKNQQFVERLKKIKLVITDVDGCLTDNKIYMLARGEEVKCYNVSDGLATKRASTNNLLKIALLSGKNGKSVELRAKNLGIPQDLIYLGYELNKLEMVKKIQEEQNVSKEETLYFGDDVPDISAKDGVSLFISPSNVMFYIRPHADLIIPKEGGSGAFRLLLDLVLFVQKKHFAQNLIEDILES
ncbi:TPA: 3-deoxy-D-manno-octulosonate 8-phosphate phosphatase [Candidatus Dependentiae bacterium]|nr:MAG: GTPase EngB [candidate division TM6 bacterium GW2011_GWE2_31_21]KKP53717.1 MAG: GTPase EngB [candidate division TM6 bacterium GW2011_GWF2_33_332]HBS48531.1 3-deoxy-D-manno-octulosonate 8-phosphate phosphatase [Candidatus Dependentiae bacterium]HBZ73146.1 3-deoxy-D-manno-octulosonate 8-phosphate phosphatase [Candidatus Dependentiae bacterium]